MQHDAPDRTGFALPELPADREDRGAWLREATDVVDAATKAAASSEATWSLARLLTFAAAVAAFFLLHGTVWLAFLGAAVGLIAFAFARDRHRRWVERVQLHRLLATVLDESNHRLGGEPVVIRSGTDPGDDPLPPLASPDDVWRISPQEEEDLDLFAEPMSVFGVLNRTSTALGAKRLAHLLREPLLDADAIERRQQAVRHLGERAAPRTTLLAAAAGLRDLDNQLDRFLDTVRDAEPLSRFATNPLWRVWTGVVLTAAIVHVMLYPGRWLVTLAAVVLVNLPVLLRTRTELLERLRPWLTLDQVVPRLSFLATTANETLPSDGLLGDLRKRFERASEPPVLPHLARRIPFLFLGYSGMLHKLINAITLWDLHVMTSLERSYVQHREALLDVVEAVADLEVFLCLATYGWDEPHVAMPEVDRTNRKLVIDGGHHPLISKQFVVKNGLDFELPKRVWIITGSNMSGKSTYLRMVGSCCLLAQIGGYVPADAMTFTPSALLTDLRIRDDLSKEESYFLAEVRQIKRLLDRSRSGSPLIGLIDEPFRGTNSEERLGAATAVIEALIAGHGFFLVATHDRQVTDLADGKAVENRHFRETLEEETMSFDYQIRTGPATVRNAIKVLEVEGYPASVVESARRVVREIDGA